MDGAAAPLGLLLMLLGMTGPQRWSRRVFHVPKGISYMVENSQWGTRIARALGFRWIDKDCHLTRDGVWVFGHWGLIAKNGIILPRWFRRKYGRRPKISDVTWADLALLQSTWLSFNSKRRKVRFVRAEDGLRLIHVLGMGCMAEQKGDEGFRHQEFWEDAEAMLARVGMPNNRLVVATLPTMRGAGAVLRAAHEAGRQTMVIRAQDGVPRSWAPYIDWHRGRIKWKSA
jgi:hypothetical protein